MARKRKTVDRTPICDPAYVRRIDPLWIPGPVPAGFWEDPSHRRDYLLRAATDLGFRSMEDFYGLQLWNCYRENKGRGLIKYWGHSALVAVEDCFPQHDWKPWLFAEVENGFWHSPANRRSYLAWLGDRLGYRCPDDWYAVTFDDFLENRGNGLLKYYHQSPALAVMALIPAPDWCEWKFHHVPPGFWDAAKNRHRYLRWLGKDLGFRRPEDWYRIQTRDFESRHGSTLLTKYSSFYDLLREFLPRLNWDRIDRHRPIRVEEILAWADDHHARHGTWPTSRSGVIPATGQTWLAIDEGMRSGLRGLPARTSLTRFLAKHREARLGRRRPILTEEQILAWADAYLAAKGKWPTRRSGPIPGTQETWGAVMSAMFMGCRGMPRGSSLTQLLARRRQ